ncbi:MAG: hypothetical protein DRN53_03675 [Thermoprotei archaeon]|nr:MAG: hypothetical protein DRN53_03675 [Thermoprotei archaeon]
MRVLSRIFRRRKKDRYREEVDRDIKQFKKLLKSHLRVEERLERGEVDLEEWIRASRPLSPQIQEKLELEEVEV